MSAVELTRAGRRGRGKGIRFLKKCAESQTDACIFWPFYTMKNGYGQVGLHSGMELAHRQVCFMVHGQPPADKPQAAHYCGNRSCCNPRHIRWASQSENEKDKHLHGTYDTRRASASLSEDDVRAIREVYAKTGNAAAAGRSVGTSGGVAIAVIKGRTYRHVT